MGKIFAVEYLTLDGGFEDPGWSGPYFNEELQQFQFDNLLECDALLLGRVTYQGFAQAWPSMEAETGDFGRRMNSIGKYVASTTLGAPEWNATLIEGHVIDAVKRLRASEETLMIAGSATLVESLRSYGLIDEYRLMIYPVVVGHGRRFFGEAPSSMTLVNSLVTKSGVAVLTYHPDESREPSYSG
ncbi:dihydrofolate reductase [Jatrophihabitans sp. GAS493]|uniref:dihydrofolate reductase family protein n=1 Tax=Jatrophihabitans sp. GAS493 TaxID=1907575 RepID=UPI000BB68E9B|nr:dihydrofolate reductase family protein [Jatrophihabitans sp. GAS493]SOD72820.1 dihydrofolate reductase [Jatrophihabitans sp. GAS493]